MEGLVKMIGRYGYNFVRWKDHIQRLPIREDLVEPYESDPDAEMILITTLFVYPGEDPADLLSHTVPGIIYQRRSFEQHSDIAELGIPYRVYCSHHAYKTVLPALKYAGFLESEVIRYKSVDLGDEYTLPFGERCGCLFAEEFEQYKAIYLLDSDVFLARTARAKDARYPLLKFTELSEDQIWVAHATDWTWDLEDGYRGNWVRRVHYDHERWGELAAAFIGDDIKDEDVRKMKLVNANLSSCYYPRKMLSGEFGEWYKYALEVLQDDEGALAVWSATNEWPVAFDEEVGLVTHQGVDELVYRLDESVDFYLAHCRPGWEELWRRQVGIS